MTRLLLAAYWCPACEVAGRSAADAPLCWCCGQPARVTARASPPPMAGAP